MSSERCEIFIKSFRVLNCSSIHPTLLRTECDCWKFAFKMYANANDIQDQNKLKNNLKNVGFSIMLMIVGI